MIMCSSKSRGGSILQKSSSFNGHRPPPNRAPLLERRNSINTRININNNNNNDSTTLPPPVPGSIAAARREQVATLHEQRKIRIAHYGRSLSTNNIIVNNNNNNNNIHHDAQEIKRCSFITPNSDPVYVAYHDQEWGVPVHDDKLMFELLVLTGAQVGSDWASVLRRRQDFRDAFSGFDVHLVSGFSEKKMASIAADYCFHLSFVRGVVDNSKRILEIKKEIGSFEKYMWGFVNNKAMVTGYKWCNKMPAKTSKSETISKDMVRRGFRSVGPTVIHSFMQAAGLTNDHLITCPRHSQLQLVPSATSSST